MPAEDAIAAMLSLAWIDRRIARALSGWGITRGALVKVPTEKIVEVNIVGCNVLCEEAIVRLEKDPRYSDGPRFQ